MYFEYYVTMVIFSKFFKFHFWHDPLQNSYVGYFKFTILGWDNEVYILNQFYFISSKITFLTNYQCFLAFIAAFPCIIFPPK